mmetsp:Transcript_40222/g.129202  ORF Transcript_40222/g.129202 Transcript_40222/m.129202 type:complete len:211 (+) Transcript_40222:1225-1857(+)
MEEIGSRGLQTATATTHGSEASFSTGRHLFFFALVPTRHSTVPTSTPSTSTLHLLRPASSRSSCPVVTVFGPPCVCRCVGISNIEEPAFVLSCVARSRQWRRQRARLLRLLVYSQRRLGAAGGRQCTSADFSSVEEARSRVVAALLKSVLLGLVAASSAVAARSTASGSHPATRGSQCFCFPDRARRSAIGVNNHHYHHQCMCCMEMMMR